MTPDIVVLGASAGGVSALIELCKKLPADLQAAIFVVVHTSPASPGILPQILSRAGALPAEHVNGREQWRTGRIYVAPPDRHILLGPDYQVYPTHGPKENGFRPAVDPLFRTAGRRYGPRVIGVVLSGNLDDGTEGASIIHRHGGIVVVQDPKEATFPSMPTSVIVNGIHDHIVTIEQMAGLLDRLTRTPVSPGKEVFMASDDSTPDPAEQILGMQSPPAPGPPSGFTCPECGGAIWEITNGSIVKYRCHTGHGYSPKALEAHQTDGLEAALYAAVRALEENAALRRRMAQRVDENFPSIKRKYEEQAADAEGRANSIREVLLGFQSVTPQVRKSAEEEEYKLTTASPKKGASKKARKKAEKPPRSSSTAAKRKRAG